MCYVWELQLLDVNCSLDCHPTVMNTCTEWSWRPARRAPCPRAWPPSLLMRKDYNILLSPSQQQLHANLISSHDQVNNNRVGVLFFCRVTLFYSLTLAVYTKCYISFQEGGARLLDFLRGCPVGRVRSDFYLSQWIHGLRVLRVLGSKDRCFADQWSKVLWFKATYHVKYCFY